MTYDKIYFIIGYHTNKGDCAMYKKMYLHLFNVITDVLGLLEKGNVWDAKARLIQAQQDTEEIYLSWNGDEVDKDDG